LSSHEEDLDLLAEKFLQDKISDFDKKNYLYRFDFDQDIFKEYPELRDLDGRIALISPEVFDVSAVYVNGNTAKSFINDLQ